MTVMVPTGAEQASAPVVPPGEVPREMRAWAVQRPGAMRTHPLVAVRRHVPTPGPDELLVRVLACGVCRTDVHLCEGDLAPRRPLVIPGHQIVGSVVAVGARAHRFYVGERVGLGWLRTTCGACPACRRGQENLCARARFTGWDRDGGFADYVTVPDAAALAIPGGFSAERAAPLLCAGVIGYRALKRANLEPGGRLGIWGFGSSAHLTAQIAQSQGAEIAVLTRGAANRALAEELGVRYVGSSDDLPCYDLDAAIIFASAGELVPRVLRAVRPGGTVVCAGTHMSQIPAMTYRQHLFGERDLRSVTAATRADADELFRLVPRLDLDIRTTPRTTEQTAAAVTELAERKVRASVVVVATD